MQIQFIDHADSVDLTKLFEELGYPVSNSDLSNRLNTILKKEDYYAIVALENETVVGFAGFSKMFAFEMDGQYTRILCLIVDSSYRRQGIATSMLNFIKKWSIDNNCSALTLNSGIRDERSHAHQFYERYGFNKKSFGYIFSLVSL